MLLGVRLDAFAYRQPPWASSLRIFEVDYPATQQCKRRRLSDEKVAVPENVTFVPVDFEKAAPEALKFWRVNGGGELEYQAVASRALL